MLDFAGLSYSIEYVVQEFATAGGLGSLLVLKFATSFCPDFLAYL